MTPTDVRWRSESMNPSTPRGWMSATHRASQLLGRKKERDDRRAAAEKSRVVNKADFRR